MRANNFAEPHVQKQIRRGPFLFVLAAAVTFFLVAHIGVLALVRVLRLFLFVALSRRPSGLGQCLLLI